MLRKLSKSLTFLVLTGLVLFCFALSYYRIHRFGEYGYTFLIWNLFLAGIPYLISSYLVKYGGRVKSIGSLIWLGAWLVFLPNAPYILTDVIHLSPNGTIPLWYDLMLVLSYALTGLLFGLISMLQVYTFVTREYSPRLATTSIIIMSFLCGFGIYLGRFLRWNSWDILSHPDHLLYDVAHRVAYPFDHPRTYFVTISVGVLLSALFLVMKPGYGSRETLET